MMQDRDSRRHLTVSRHNDAGTHHAKFINVKFLQNYPEYRLNASDSLPSLSLMVPSSIETLASIFWELLRGSTRTFQARVSPSNQRVLGCPKCGTSRSVYCFLGMLLLAAVLLKKKRAWPSTIRKKWSPKWMTARTCCHFWYWTQLDIHSTLISNWRVDQLEGPNFEHISTKISPNICSA